MSQMRVRKVGSVYLARIQKLATGLRAGKVLKCNRQIRINSQGVVWVACIIVPESSFL